MPASLWNPATFTRLETEILPAYLPTCRWFGGKGRTIRELRIAHAALLGGLTDARVLVIEVTFTEGAPESYVLPLSIVDSATGQFLKDAMPQAILARSEDGRVFCDAIQLPAARAELLRLIARPVNGDGHIHLTGTSRGDLDGALLERAFAESRVTGADQSNTSVIYAGRWFLKLFRKYERGPNPDVELTRFLSETQGFSQVPAYLGALQLTEPAGDAVIALLSDFTAHQGDAWSFTLDAVAHYFDRALASRADESTLEELIGPDYLDRAGQLARCTAEMHLALAAGEADPDFAAEPFSEGDQRAIYEAMRESASRVLGQLRDQAASLSQDLRSAAAEIAGSQTRIDAILARLLSHPIHAAKLRVHGDYHLGQVLNTGTDFVILDFEGEPRRPLAERRLKRSPLVDVAGMLRSFDYAGAVALGLRSMPDAERLEPWARGWVDTVSAHFRETYLTLTAGAAFLPADSADVDLLLQVFILDKAIYEIGYELSYRPAFLPVPLSAVSRLLSGKAGRPGID